MPQPWEEFTSGRGSAGPGSEDWSQLETVRHTTHLLAAIRIAEDRTLSAELIYDGVLRDTRTKVVYFSPKIWPDGSRYGAFEFAVDWQSLLNGRKMYWVEAVRTYQTPIFRFLLTDKDVSHLPVLPYDPDSDAGPIRRVGEDWYWTRNDAAEIVIDEDLPLFDVTKVTFGRHHDEYCSEGRRGTCPERGFQGSRRAKQAFIGVLFGRGIHSLDDRLLETDGFSFDACGALSDTWAAIIKAPKFGGPVTDGDQALELVRAACLTIQAGDRARVARLMGLISGESIADQAFLRLIREHFAMPNFVWSD